jgi:hypothetical protein
VSLKQAKRARKTTARERFVERKIDERGAFFMRGKLSATSVRRG